MLIAWQPTPHFIFQPTKIKRPCTVKRKNAGRKLAHACKFASIRGSSECVPTKIGHLLPARAGIWHLNETSPRVGCGGRLVAACRIDFLLFSLPLLRRWLRASRPNAHQGSASGTRRKRCPEPPTRFPPNRTRGGQTIARERNGASR